jgi:hypothetical protein
MLGKMGRGEIAFRFHVIARGKVVSRTDALVRVRTNIA